MTTDALDRLERLQQLLADELRQPLRDDAGIILYQGVEANSRAAGMRRAIAILIISDDKAVMTGA
jgi:hypothetical protein